MHTTQFRFCLPLTVQSTAYQPPQDAASHGTTYQSSHAQDLASHVNSEQQRQPVVSGSMQSQSPSAVSRVIKELRKMESVCVSGFKHIITIKRTN